jgi:hypothetical protein
MMDRLAGILWRWLLLPLVGPALLGVAGLLVCAGTPSSGSRSFGATPSVLRRPEKPAVAAETPGPGAEAPRRRSEQLERIARQADRKIRHGFELAGRKAHFAARSEFIAALRLVAQGLDTEDRTGLHSRCLSAGLTALKEAEDFIPGGSRLEADLDIASIVGGHRTPVLHNAEIENLMPLEALKCYFTFAQEQLAAAAGREVAGSMALHALGKLHGTLAGQQSSGSRATESKAMVYYQAALLVYPRNYMAANDLGVLLARCGNYRQARKLLEHGLSMHQESTGWHNLAAVYRRLGQAEAARRADVLSAAARRAETTRRTASDTPSRPQVRWVDPNAFVQTYNRPPDFWQPAPTRRVTTAAPSTRPTRAASRPGPAIPKSLTGWRMPWESAPTRK